MRPTVGFRDFQRTVRLDLERTEALAAEIAGLGGRADARAAAEALVDEQVKGTTSAAEQQTGFRRTLRAALLARSRGAPLEASLIGEALLVRLAGAIDDAGGGGATNELRTTLLLAEAEARSDLLHDEAGALAVLARIEPGNSPASEVAEERRRKLEQRQEAAEAIVAEAARAREQRRSENDAIVARGASN